MARKAHLEDQDEQEQRVLAICDRIEDELGLDWIDVSHAFHTQLRGEDSGDGQEDVETTAAVTVANWKYRTAAITWYLPMVATMSDGGLYEVAMHEYVHVLMGPLAGHISTKPNVHDLEEFTTECIARCMIRLSGATE